MYATVPLPENSALKPQDYAVWLSLCSFTTWEWKNGKPTTSGPGSCFPSLRKIAERVNCSVDTVKRSLNHLEAAGYIVREHRFHDDGGQDSNGYTLIANPKEVES